MKKSLLATSSLVLLMSAGVALAQWNHGGFPPFTEVDANQDGQVTMEEAQAHPGVAAAATQAKPGSSAEEALKSFFSEANQKYPDKPYDSPIGQEEWEGMTGK